MRTPRRRLLRGALLAALPAALGGGYLAVRARSIRSGVGQIPDDVCIVAPTFAHDPAGGLPPQAPREVPQQARCPVCGMYPARQRRWAAQVIFDDGHAQFLDSPLSLFHYLQRISRYAPGRSQEQIAAVYVSDYASGAWLAADQALYLQGSSLMGPMRAGNLPAFASADSAQPFRARHGGTLQSAPVLRERLPDELQQLAPHRH